MSYWPGTSIVKSEGNAFTVRPEAVFSCVKSEQAKATIARRGTSASTQDKSTGHGAAVMPGLSDQAKKKLKAKPYGQQPPRLDA